MHEDPLPQIKYSIVISGYHNSILVILNDIFELPTLKYIYAPNVITSQVNDPSLMPGRIRQKNVLCQNVTNTRDTSCSTSFDSGNPPICRISSINSIVNCNYCTMTDYKHDILVGGCKIALTGGVDSMSMAPYAVRDIRFGTRLGSDPIMEDTLWASLTDSYCKTPMGVTAENLSAKYNITREDADAFALKSQLNWKAGADGGHFDAEITPVTVKSRKGPVEFTVDEHPKPNTKIEGLAKLPTVFKKNGTVTPGSASGICDGAGAVVIASEEACTEHNLVPLARLVGYSVAGVDPNIMGIGPAPAIQALLKKAGLELKDVGMVEINEAFAPQTIACQRELDLDPSILNMDGGAIALGHPLGASGARITAHVAHEIRRRGLKYGIGSACIGGGQGIALLLEAM
ncbi:unnamed protein product, partial [Meganyctiphanes norvegica]